MGTSEDAEQSAIAGFLARLEELAPKVRGDAFLNVGLEGMIPLQRQIGDLQQDIQRAISTTKKQLKKSEAKRQHLATLSHIRWLSRRLGDALAWNVLILDRKVLRSLGDGRRVPVHPNADAGSMAVWAMAEQCATNGWGIPIVHDITTCLQIGDFTAMTLGADSKSPAFRTFEVKSHVLGEEVDEKGDPYVSLQASINGVEPLPPMMNSRVLATPKGKEAERPELRPDRRLEQQMTRLERAVKLKNSAMDSMTVVDGRGHLNLKAYGADDKQDWAGLLAAVEKARRDGYAWFSHDHFLGWGVFYNKDGVPVEQVQSDQMVKDARELIEGSSGPGFILVKSVPDNEDADYSADAMPFYLWQVPQDVITDLLRNRLLIVGFANSGRLKDALAEAGFVVTHGSKKTRWDFKLEAGIEWENGVTATIEVPVPWREATIALLEFQTLGNVVAKAAAVFDIPKQFTPEEMFSPAADEQAS